jgi:hypothetical protein
MSVKKKLAHKANFALKHVLSRRLMCGSSAFVEYMDQDMEALPT